METQNKEVAALVTKIAGLHAAIAKLASLSPSPDLDALFADLITTCIQPNPVDVTKLGPDAQRMREELIRLRATAASLLEDHYSDALATFDNPLDHLDLLLHIPGLAPSHVAFIGSGPVPFSSLVLAARHLPRAHLDNYDRCGAANDRARRLVRADKDLSARMSFRTADVADLTDELGGYDVVFLALLVGMTVEEKAEVIHMANGATLVLRSAHGARGFLYPVVDLEDIRRGGFEVLTAHHPKDDSIISVIVARKICNGSLNLK